LPNVQAPSFLSGKAKQFGLPNPKAGFADIHRNIEQGLLLDPLRNEHKITSNFPRTPFAKMVLLAVQSYEQNAATVQQMLDETLQKATAVDGVTGEKGLANYSALAVRAIAHIVGLFDRVYPKLLARAVERFRLRDTFRFHLDTWILGRYYPLIGDTGIIGQQITQYCGVDFLRLPALGTGIFDPRPLFTSSMFTFFWRLYEHTGDVDFVRVLYQANANSVEGLPHDLLADNPARFQQRVKRVIAQHDRFMHSTFGSGGSPPRRREAPAGGDGRGGPLAPSAQFPQAPPREGARVGRFAFGTAAGAADERGRTDEEHAADGAAWMRC